jgi:hypothetical protein
MMDKRIIGAYYLGCPMRDSISNAFADLLLLQKASLAADSKLDLSSFHVLKVNFIY